MKEVKINSKESKERSDKDVQVSKMLVGVNLDSIWEYVHANLLVICNCVQ